MFVFFKCVQSSQYFNNNFYIYRVIVSSLFPCVNCNVQWLSKAFEARAFTHAPLDFGSPDMRIHKTPILWMFLIFSVVSSSVIRFFLWKWMIYNWKFFFLLCCFSVIFFFRPKKIKSIRLDRNFKFIFRCHL